MQVVFALLATLSDPTEQEWKIIVPLLDDPTNPLKIEAWILLNSSTAWFRLVDSLGLIEKWLATQDDDRVNRTVQLLTNVVKALPDRVAELVEPYVGMSEDWNNRLVYLMQWGEKGAGRRFFELFQKLVDEGVLDEARGPIAVNSDFWMLTYSLPKERPDWAAEVIGHYCNRHLERSLAAGNPNPFGFPATIPDSQHDDRYLLQAAEGAPLKFIEQVLPFMLRVMELTAVRTKEPPWRDEVWYFRTVSDGYSFEHALLTAMEKALSLLAENEPDSFAPFAAQLSQSDFETAQFLLIRAYAANGQRFADEAAEYLCSHPARLKAGYVDNTHWASRLLIQAITPFCSDENLLRLEDALLRYYTDWERRADGCCGRGYSQFELLDGIAVSRQSERVKRRLGEWRRKFNRQTADPPKGIVGGMVGSPIPQEAAAKMTDAQWLRAIAKHHTDDRPFRVEGDDLIGGAHTLANVLEHCAKEDPMRFAKLACQFPDTANPCYFNGVLRGVADVSLEPALIGELCERCHQLPHRPCGQWICWLVRKQSSQPLPDPVLDIVAWYATEDADPQRELWRTDAGNGQVYYHGEIEAHAINTVRGSAAETMASLLFQDKSRLMRFLPALEKMVDDTSIAVRSCVAEVLTATLNCDRALAVALFLRLCEIEDDLLQTRGIERFLLYGLQTHYEALAPVLERMLDCDLEKANIAGARVACLIALNDEAARSLVEKCLTGDEAYRIGTAQVFAANLCSARYRVYCETALRRLFNDSSEQVRAEVSRCFSHFKDQDLSAYTDLIKDFVQSKAFVEHYGSLFHALKEATGKLPEITCIACEGFTEIAGTAAADARTHAAADSYQVTELIVRAYRQYEDEVIQVRCLDLIDRLAQARALGLDQAVS